METFNLTRCDLHNKAEWHEVIVEKKIANMLGVAAVDVPIEEIESYFISHKTGVNGHAYLVTNNGFVLFHPNLRPTFYGILKPNYNSVDLVELEMIDDEGGPRDIHPDLVELRKSILSYQYSIGKKTLMVKQHYDGMKRVFTLERHYFYTGINGTPFSVVISVPSLYGQYMAVEPTIDVRRESVEDYFVGNWTLHPLWKYCYYYYDNAHEFNNPEEQFRHFLSRMDQKDWQWAIPNSYPSNTGANAQPNLDSYFCDRELVLSVIYHAKITKWFADRTQDSEWKRIKSRFNVTLTFLSFHSGFTRWNCFDDNEIDLIYKNNKAIDEVWYRRAAEFFKDNKESFIYSIPFEIDEECSCVVTVSQAVFVPRNEHKYPMAVTGYRISLSSFHSLLENITFTCPAGMSCFSETCKSDRFQCYLIDNNGYIVVSENKSHAGKFFGELHGSVMNSMVEEGVYRRVPMFDYQGICFRPIVETNLASLISLPLDQFKWILSKVLWLLLELLLPQQVHSPSCEYNDSDIRNDIYYKYIKIGRSYPELCDTQTDLYTLTNSTRAYSKKSDAVNRPYVVQRIVFSNLILVVVDNDTHDGESLSVTIPNESKEYNDSLPCFKFQYFSFVRHTLDSCISYNEEELNITEQCGRSSPRTTADVKKIFLFIIFTYVSYCMHKQQ